jgi:Fe-S-cluster containining protein
VDTRPARDLDAAQRELRALHAEVDDRARSLAARHADRLQCTRGCARCCADDLTVFAVEALHIRRHHAALLREGAPHPTGACAFLSADAACRIYPERPYICRTQGLPLRWFERAGGEVVERRDICPLEDSGPPITELADRDCWLVGPYEERLAAIQQRLDGGAERPAPRIALRSLFSRTT